MSVASSNPLEPLVLAESQHVKITISNVAAVRSFRDLAMIETAQQEIRALDEVPTIEEVRAALAVIPGSLSDEVSAERGDH